MRSNRCRRVEKSLPPLVIHETDLTPARREPEIGVVDPKQQPMLGPRREHPIGLETSLGDQIVDENADVRLVAPELESARPRASASAECGVDPCDQTLRRGFLVPRRAVDLSGQEQPGDALGLETTGELGRLNEVVFDGVGGTKQHGVLETRERVHEVRLHLPRQAHREAVDVDLRRVESLRLEKDLVTLLVRKADDLVLERRAVARTDPAESDR